MSLNDKGISGAQGADTWPGVTNPTSASNNSDPKAANFMSDPTTEDTGAGAPANFDGHLNAAKQMKGAAGVVEARPGIIEAANIDPLNERSSENDGWANANTVTGTGGTDPPAYGTAANLASSAAITATGAAKVAYGTVTGDQETVEAGKKEVYGS